MRKLPTNYRRVRLEETDTRAERQLIHCYLRRLCLRRGVKTPRPWMIGLATAWARSVLAYPRDRTWGIRMMGALGGKRAALADAGSRVPYPKLREARAVAQARRRFRQRCREAEALGRPIVRHRVLSLG
jgi:hypothetical protein